MSRAGPMCTSRSTLSGLRRQPHGGRCGCPRCRLAAPPRHEAGLELCLARLQVRPARHEPVPAEWDEALAAFPSGVVETESVRQHLQDIEDRTVTCRRCDIAFEAVEPTSSCP